MDLPNNLKYSKDHVWCRENGENIICGITDFAQAQLKDIVFVGLPEKGKEIEQGKRAAVIESVKSVSDVIAPVNGEVVEVNSKLVDNPEIINSDCYGEGWLFKVKAGDLGKLMSADGYKRITESK